MKSAAAARPEAPKEAPREVPREIPRTPAETTPPGAQLVLTTGAETPTAATRPKPLYKRWWLWTTVGVASAALAVGLGVGLTAGGSHFSSTLPDHSLAGSHP